MVPVLLRLKEQAKDDGTWVGLHHHGKAPTLVFSSEYGISTLLPTLGTTRIFIGAGKRVFPGAYLRQNEKKGVYGISIIVDRNKDYLRELLNERSADTFLRHFARSMIFGPERDVPFLGRDFKLIRHDEIEQEVNAYEALPGSFTRGRHKASAHLRDHARGWKL